MLPWSILTRGPTAVNRSRARFVDDKSGDPGHPRADDRGFRLDVIELVRELGGFDRFHSQAADRVKIACLALASSRGRGRSMDLRVECPSYGNAKFGEVPCLYAAAGGSPGAAGCDGARD
jgi:hypothetical protein